MDEGARTRIGEPPDVAEIEQPAATGPRGGAAGPPRPSALLAALLLQAREGVLLLDPDGRVLQANPAAAGMLGGAPVGRSLPELGWSRASVEAIRRHAAAPEGTRLALGLATEPRDGAVEPLALSASSLGAGWVLVSLREAREPIPARLPGRRLDLVASAVGFGIYELDLPRGVATWSRELYDMVGLPSGSPVDGHTLVRMAAVEDRARVEQVLGVEGYERPAVEFRVHRPDGEVRWVRHLARCLPSARARIQRVVGIVQDVTERHQAEAALRASEERLRLAMGAARMFSVETDLATGLQRFSENAARVLGLEALPEVLEDRAGWWSVVHPDDLEQARAGLDRLTEVGEGSVEYRVRGGDGYRWLAIHQSLVRDPLGRPLRVLGVAQDVTERRRAAQVARARELEAFARLHAIAMRAVDEDLTGLFAEIVDAALAITGADVGMLQVRDPRTGQTSVVALRGGGLVDDRPPGPRCLAAVGELALARGERVVVDDLDRPPLGLSGEALDDLRAGRFRAAQATPLATRSGGILGALSIHHRADRPRAESDLRALNLLSRLSADLLEQRRLVDELRAADRRHRAFLGAVAEPVVIVDPQGRIAYANAQAEQVFGYGPGELDGLSHAVLIPERLRLLHGLHPRRFPVERAADPFRADRPFGLRRDGSEFPAEVSVNPVHTAQGTMLSAVIRDVGERLRLETAARLHAERLASAVESLPDPIAVWDGGDRLVVCNAPFRELVASLGPGRGLAGPLTGAQVDGWVADALRREGDPAVPSPESFTRVSAADLCFPGGRRWRVSTRGMPGGERVTVAVDLTEELLRQRALESARAEAEAASRAKSEFLASMSHELRTPLNAVLGFCQLLMRDRREPLTERQREMVALAFRGGEHLLHLIDDALDLARIEANRVSIAAEPVSVEGAIRETVEALEPTAREAGVRLHVDPPSEETPAVDADPRRVVQILMNLGSNAVKYNRRGGNARFRVERRGPEGVRVTVVDTGPGIAQEHRARLFQPFQRAGQETGPVQGTGMGLAISKRLAELMGGRVGFESVVGEGSAFWVELPAAGARPVQVVPPAPPRPLLGSRVGRVMYVEDNPASVAVLRAALEMLDGVEFQAAGSAEEGLARIAEVLPDVVFLDVNLPGMGGLEAARRLSADPRTRDIPLVAVTAAASAADRIRGEQAGFRRYLTKPIAMDELEAVLDEVLTERGATVTMQDHVKHDDPIHRKGHAESMILVETG